MNVSDVTDPELIDAVGLGRCEQQVRAEARSMLSIGGFRLKRFGLNRHQAPYFQEFSHAANAALVSHVAQFIGDTRAP